jgi:RNA-directed DNA polymerase
MLSALVNGVKGGKWYALMDKVFAPDTLAAAWKKVRANKGAAGVDGQSIEPFEARAGFVSPSCRHVMAGALLGGF